MDKKIVDLLNEQIMKELYSAYIYLNMANYYASEGLDGFDNWFYVQAQEEQDHAMLIREYLLYNDQKVELLPIDAPPERYKSFSEPLDFFLVHEKEVTASIHNIYSEAHDLKDFRTMEFLNWFVSEQAEEEKNANEMIDKFKLFGQDSNGLYQLNQELSTRVHTPPSLVLD